jgi:hypothetical protein
MRFDMVLARAMGEIAKDHFGVRDVEPLKLPDNLD